jgi:NtrC-family two-component system sensor histidine kinase KinB
VAKAVQTEGNIAPVTDLSLTIPVERHGTTQRLLPRVVPVPGLAGDQRGGGILVLYDVTDLARLDEMRSELVAVASHELQTPLTTLRMTLLMLQEASAALPTRERELVATSLIGVEQLAETVHEFLDLTRIEAGELRLSLEPVHLPSLVGDVIRRTEPQAGALGIALTASVAHDLPIVIADPRRLRVVFDNLVSNALKYTPNGGTITVVGQAATQDAVTVMVTDTGPGVPPASRSRIFDKFFRLEHHHQTDDQRHPRGAGIGLYLCRQIVELHGGRIECAAGPDDHGARISVFLPVRTENAVATTSIDSFTATVG